MSSADHSPADLLLSVIVPVFDQEGVIAENVRVIGERIAERLEGEFEIIVVSDGSLDGSAERVLERELPRVRVLHYDRNLGKGYAIKTGAREARGRFVGYVDADLDLDPAGLPAFLAVAQRERLDFVIGSKRHPDSRVHYPRSRVAASWLYQQLVRALFRLDVRDTQVGLKLFRREVADEVLPFLLVKRYAFDIELLAVARSFGYGAIREMPIVLDYRFTGSGVRSMAVARALIDTLAVFYRLRLLRYYRRRRARSSEFTRGLPDAFAGEVELVEGDEVATRRRAAEASQAEVIAYLEPGARPSANWLSSSAPFFSLPELDVVVTPQLAPAGGRARERAAAAIAESRVGGGSLYFRFTPGAIRFVSDFPARSFLVRRSRFLALPPATPPESVVMELAAGGRHALYLPEASVTIPPAPLFLPHLRRIASYGRARGALVRRSRGRATRVSTVGAVGLLSWTIGGWLLLLAGAAGLDALIVVWVAYGVVVLASGAIGGLRFYSLRVAALTSVGLVLTHIAYALGFVSGFARRPARPSSRPHGRRSSSA